MPMQSLPLSQVKLTDAFWRERQQIIKDVTLLHQFSQLEKHGQLANFQLVIEKSSEPYNGPIYSDSDVYKWLEACAYAIGADSSGPTFEAAKRTVLLIEKAQESDGYIQTHFQHRHPALRYKNMAFGHELYCGGHLIEAAVALTESGSPLGPTLLSVAKRYADHLLATFSSDQDNRICGHEEIELALLRLDQLLGFKKYTPLALKMLQQRGLRPSVFDEEMNDAAAREIPLREVNLLVKQGQYSGEYCQDHAPLPEHETVVGHAVRAMYYYIAATEASSQLPAEWEEAILRVWNNLTTRRMYVTGGIGPSAANEGFTADYDLPNLDAYAETCASCGLILWASKLTQLTGNSDFVDVLERALYNGALSGISLSGDRFFYDNPLESIGNKQRSPWFTTACCPPNIARIIGSVSRFAIGVSNDSIWIHLPIGLEFTHLIGTSKVSVKIESQYVWQGKYAVSISCDRPTKFALRLRIPDWADDVEMELPEETEGAGFELGYAVYDRVWSGTSTVTVDLNVQPQWIESHPKVLQNLGRVALRRGPFIYCAEEVDLGFTPQLLSVDVNEEPIKSTAAGLQGIVALQVPAYAKQEDFTDGLYAELGTVSTTETTAKLIPYFAWANRKQGGMQVWLRQN